MGKYDFDKPTNRRGIGSLKWDVGENELPMWVADMDFETVPEVKAAIKKTAEHGIFGYSTVPDEFFLAFSDFWKNRHGYEFKPENMIFSTGIVAAISSMVRKLTTPAENVLIMAPVYNIFYNCIRNNGRNIISSDLVYSDGEWSIDFLDLEAKLSDPQTSLMILCNPHNPVGKIWDSETLARIGHLCAENGVTVISDEIHCSLTMPGKNYVPFASVNSECERISATCLACSKTFNLAGLQSAVIAVSDPQLRHKIWRGINTDEVGEPNVFAVNANIAALRYGAEWLDELNMYIAGNKRYAVSFICENMPKLKAYVADATYLLWVDISAYSLNSEAFAHDLRAKTGLYVNDGAEYGHGGEGFLRINLATQRKNVEDGMARLCNYIKALDLF